VASALELLFDAQVAQAGLSAFVPEYRFAADRRWRFDRADPVHHIAVELEGGVFVLAAVLEVVRATRRE